MKTKSNMVALVVGISVMMMAVAGIGFIAGRFAMKRTFSVEIEKVFEASNLNGILDDEEKTDIIKVYHNGDEVLHQLNDITWAVPNTPTPFVGNAPAPGKYGITTINSLQIRSAGEVVMPKPDNTFRIFFTGGSTAFGVGAPSEQRTIAGYLSTILARDMTPHTNLKYEVFTMANPAWATTHERIIIENRLSELEPDLVISFSGCNDVHWGRRGRNVLWFRSYADEFFLDLVNKAYELSNRQAMPEIVQVEEDEIAPSLVAQRLEKNVALSSFVLSQKKTDYLFLLQPTLALTGKTLTERERDSLKDQDYFRKCYACIDDALNDFQADNYRYINLTSVFDDVEGKEEIFMDSYHFGDKGNEIIAQKIFLHIKDLLTP